jgi:hypothetical protein
MRSIEIPQPKDRDRIYRLFEMLPGVLSWGVLLLPAVLSLISPTLAAYFIIAYLLIWFIKSIVLNMRMIQGYNLLNRNMAYDWNRLLNELDDPAKAFRGDDASIGPKWHRDNLISVKVRENRLFKHDLYHVIIVALSTEPIEIIEPTIKSVLKSDYDMKKVMLIIAHEQRCETSGPIATELVQKYRHHFYWMEAVEHPKAIPGEVVGKGPNITFAGKRVKELLDEKSVEYDKVILTTLDSDNRPHPQYLPAVTYAFIACPDPVRTSFQPVIIYTNNIWDAPAPMRVIAAGNSFWNIVLSLRPHMLRNFSSHSQSFQALVDTDFWSCRTIVEDGHQFWRTYLRYNGNHDAHPILLPIYIDAVLASTLRKTIKAQFNQIKRWAWGATDIAFMLQKGWREKNSIPKVDLFFKTIRLIDNHVSWATAPLLLLLAAFVPLYVAPQSRLNIVANQLPLIASRVQTLALVGISVSIYLSIRLLPPKPARYKNRRKLYMIIQWVWLPFTTLIFNGLAALYSQTRLMFGWYLGKFDITEKAVKK